MRIVDIFKYRVARFADAMGARLLQPNGSIVAVPYVLDFPDFVPSIVASYVAGSTVSQSGNTVTVTATGHGIVGSVLKNGRRIYFPGSPSIPAGWYPDFAWLDANTVTFQRTTMSLVASESVNGGAAFTSTVTVCTRTLPGGSMGARGRISLVSLRSGDAVVGARFMRLVFGGTIMHGIALGTQAQSEVRQTVRNVSESSQVSSPQSDGAVSPNSITTGAINTAIDQSVAVTLTISAAAGWVCIEACELEVLYK